MDFRWCVLDLDGTTLNSKGRLSDENVEAIKALAETGVGIVLATGRSDLFVRDFVSRLGVTLPVISCNGGLVRDVHSGEVLFGRPIPELKTKELAEYVIQNGYDTLAYSYDHVYYFRGSEKIGLYHSYNAEVEAAFRVPLREASAGGDLPITKVLKFFVSHIDPEIAGRLASEINSDGSLSTVQSMRDVLDIMASGITKGEALRFLAERLGMDLRETIVFGDNHNDISMLKLAGWPIVPGNAEEDAKKIAKHVVPSNDDNGVAWAIRELILAKKG